MTTPASHIWRKFRVAHLCLSFLCGIKCDQILQSCRYKRLWFQGIWIVFSSEFTDKPFRVWHMSSSYASLELLPDDKSIINFERTREFCPSTQDPRAFIWIMSPDFKILYVGVGQVVLCYFYILIFYYTEMKVVSCSYTNNYNHSLMYSSSIKQKFRVSVLTHHDAEYR